MNAIALLQSSGGATAALVNFLPIIAIGVVFLIIVIGAANKQRKKKKQNLSTLIK